MSIDFSQVPAIPANLGLEDLHLLIPPGFESIVSHHVEGTDLIITLKNSESKDDSIITVRPTLFNPKALNTFWCKFLFEISTLSNKPVDYFGQNANCVLNQNQMLYMIFQHRFTDFLDRKRAFKGLLQKDLSALMSFISYIAPTSHNAIKRLENTYVVLSPWTKTSTLNNRLISDFNTNPCIGNILNHASFIPADEEAWQVILKDLPVHPSSESSMSKTAKVVLSDDNGLYRSPGYQMDMAGNKFKSLFQSGQNITARQKTHLISNAYELKHPSESHFIQDHIYNESTGQYEMKDGCLRKSIVVFHPMNLENNRFVFGEIEASQEFVNTKIWQQRTITEQFEEIHLEDNVICSSDSSGRVCLGLDLNMEPVYINNCDEAVISHRTLSGTLGAQRLTVKFVSRAGNARIDSNTGIKGVTKCLPNLGSIVFPDFTMIPDTDEEVEFKHPQLQNETVDFDSYPSTHFKEKFKDLALKPDLVLGMNATKAKANTIALARAALAIELGCYKSVHYTGKLHTLDEAAVNAASESLPEFYYIDQFGNQVAVDVGIVYVRYTELGSTYTKLKNQPFMFVAGNVLQQNSPKLQNVIWKEYIEQSKRECILELEKILSDKKGVFQDIDKLPRYTPKQLIQGKILKEVDLITSTMDIKLHGSKLLDPEWNKGFYIDCSGHKGPIIRVPSAAVLNQFVCQLPDKMWTYGKTILNISKMLACVIPTKANLGTMNIGYLFDKDQKRFTNYVQYMNEIKSVLYSGENGSQMMIQALSKPMVPGFSMKQVVEPLLPAGVICIFNANLYDRIANLVYGADAPLHLLTTGLYVPALRNPFLWTSQFTVCKVWNYEDLKTYLWHVKGIKIENYICDYENKDIVLVSTDVCLKAHSDNDKHL